MRQRGKEKPGLVDIRTPVIKNLKADGMWPVDNFKIVRFKIISNYTTYSIKWALLGICLNMNVLVSDLSLFSVGCLL